MRMRARIEHVTLQPDFGRKRGANFQRAAGQRPRIHQHFEFQSIEMQVDPVKLAARKRIDERLESDDAAAEDPVVLVRGA